MEKEKQKKYAMCMFIPKDLAEKVDVECSRNLVSKVDLFRTGTTLLLEHLAKRKEGYDTVVFRNSKTGEEKTVQYFFPF